MLTQIKGWLVERQGLLIQLYWWPVLNHLFVPIVFNCIVYCEWLVFILLMILIFKVDLLLLFLPQAFIESLFIFLALSLVFECEFRVLVSQFPHCRRMPWRGHQNAQIRLLVILDIRFPGSFSFISLGWFLRDLSLPRWVVVVNLSDLCFEVGSFHVATGHNEDGLFPTLIIFS